MRAPLVLACLALALIGGMVASVLAFKAYGALQLEEEVPYPLPTPISAAAPNAGEPTSAADTDLGAAVDAGELRMQLADLTAEVDRLRREVAGLREGTARSPVQPTASDREPDPSAPVVAQVNREAILQVMGEEEERNRAERQAEREERWNRDVLDRARRMGEELGLDAAGSSALGEILLEQHARQRAAWESVRGIDADDARELMRTAMEDIDAWRNAEIASRLGQDVATGVSELEDRSDRWRRRDDGGQRR